MPVPQFRSCAVLFVLLLAVFAAVAADPQPRQMLLTLRDRVPEGDRYTVRERTEIWSPQHTAIIICDMWDLHHCKRAVDRVGELAPRMNEVVAKARDWGVFIIHAPSDCMAPYENTPMRRRAKKAPKTANLP